MKHLARKITSIVLLILIFSVLTSFSSNSKKEETILRNIEVLSKGEGSGSLTPCVSGEGRCFINGLPHYGMGIKK